MDFDRLANRHKDAVYRQLYRMCGNREDAEDVLVESLTKAYRYMSDLRDEDTFRAWLAQIARRTCGRLKKREAMHPILALGSLEQTGFEPSVESNQEEIAAESELRSCVLGAYQQLPQIYRDVYTMRDIDGKTAEETAQALNLSVAAVKSRLHRARQFIRERIDGSLV